VVSRLGTVAGTFYVPDAATEVDAKGRKVISATDFVAEHRVQTVFGIGGAFASGQLLVCLVFCNEHVPRSVVDAFQSPFLRFKTAAAPLLKQVFEEGAVTSWVADAANDPRATSGEETTSALREKDEQLRALNKLYLDLESQLEDRTRSLRLILDSTGEGMMLVDLDGNLYGERTHMLESWFGVPEPKQKVWDYLFQPESDTALAFAASFGQFVDDVLPFDLVADQMPKTFVQRGVSFALSYRKVEAPEQPSRLLVIVRDVTSQVAAERAAAQARELHAVVRNVLRDKRGFDRFVEDTSELLSRVVAATDEKQQRRDLHTLKGNSAVVGFVTLPGVIHEVEGRQIERGGLLPETELETLRHAWSDALSMVADFVRGGDDRIEISFREHAEFIDQLVSGIDAEHLASIARSWRDEPTATLLRRLGAHAERTASVLGKSVEVSVSDSGHRVPLESTRDCWTSLVHVVRNAIDHGIEAEDERAAQGKSPAGKLHLACVRDADGITVTIRDDGRGVDWEAVRRSARAAGLPCDTRAELVEALFADGCSTRSEVNGVSGRGVGLAAVRAAVRAIGGDVELTTTPNAGTEIRARIPILAERHVGKRPSIAA
jgi:two-component system chemotaxis sensor kinase CheA